MPGRGSRSTLPSTSRLPSKPSTPSSECSISPRSRRAGTECPSSDRGSSRGSSNKNSFCDDQRMLRRDVEAAADLLDQILAKIKAGELRAPGRVVARLEGAVIGLRGVAEKTPAASEPADHPFGGQS